MQDHKIEFDPRESRIVNGFDTKGPLPYQLQHKGCGAILISKTYAITAHHCAYGAYPMRVGNEMIAGAYCKERRFQEKSIMPFHKIDTKRVSFYLNTEPKPGPSLAQVYRCYST